MSEQPVADDSRLFAFLGYLLGIVGFLVVLLARKEDRFAMFHAKQSLVLFFGWVLTGVLWTIPVPFMGWFTAVVLSFFLVILWIMGMIYALVGDWKALPVAGEIAAKLNI